VLTASQELAAYFEDVARLLPGQAKLGANWVMGELLGRLNKEELDIRQAPISASVLAGLLRRIADGTISGKIAKDVFDALWDRGGDADQIIDAQGLRQISDSAEIEKIVEAIVAANPAQVAEFRAGRQKAFNFFVGQVMKASRGKANPAQVNEILRRKLSG
jgi:aspartyl-tRNA(Asn)/glutamyl-tRNA(Gln) amidotransferase subunit B